jgi:hypothetical protein
MKSVPGLAVVLTSLALVPLAQGSEPLPNRAHVIALASHPLDLAGELPVVPAELSAPADAGRGYFLVKLPAPVTAERLEALRAAAGRVYTYLPYDTFVVSLPSSTEGARELARQRSGALWVGPYHPYYKLSPRFSLLRQALVADGVLAAPAVVLLQVYPDADLTAVARQVEALLPGKLVGRSTGERFSRLRLVLPPAQAVAAAEDLARIPEVFWVEIEGRRSFLNDTTIWVGQSGASGPQTTPIFDQGIFGQGQVAAVLDTGIDPDMCYFHDPVNGLPTNLNPCDGGTLVNPGHRKLHAVNFLWANECNGGIASNEWDTQDHGTHVAGILAGDNFANPLTHDPGDGMAPGARLVIQDCGFQTDDCADCPGIGCPVVDLNPVFQQAFDQGARIHNNSWGDRENFPFPQIYSAGSEDADLFMWNHKDFLLVFAAGNSGPSSSTVLSPANAKNVLSAGATQRAVSAESMAGFSSCGPTIDGRIKPDITIPGSQIISANSDNNTGSNNCNTRSLSGTSMASPATAGLTTLVRQYYTDGWHPTGAQVPADGFTPSAALLKATVINSAVEMGNAGDIPADCQGWGRILLDNVLTFGAEPRKLFAEDDRTGFPMGSSGDTRVFVVEVTSSSELLKASLIWTDFPSTTAASVHLVNDLDLMVAGPAGTFLGNVFSGGVSVTGGTADRLNTVEQVLIPNPPVGTYTVTVRSETVPQGPQPFALVVTGAILPPAGVIFADGFESGDTSAWGAAVP